MKQFDHVKIAESPKEFMEMLFPNNDWQCDVCEAVWDLIERKPVSGKGCSVCEEIVSKLTICPTCNKIARKEKTPPDVKYRWLCRGHLYD